MCIHIRLKKCKKENQVFIVENFYLFMKARNKGKLNK